MDDTPLIEARAKVTERLKWFAGASAVVGGAPAPTTFLVTSAQVWLVLWIGRTYGVPTSKHDAVSLLAPLAAWWGGFSMWTGAMKLVGYSLPAGMTFGALISGGLTYAVGRVAQDHYEDLAQGGDGLAPPELAARSIELLLGHATMRAPRVFEHLPEVKQRLEQGVAAIREEQIPEYHLHYADQCWRFGQLIAARKNYTKALHRDPSSWHAAFQLAWLESGFDQLDESRLEALRRPDLSDGRSILLASLIRGNGADLLPGALDQWDIEVLRRSPDADSEPWWEARALETEAARQLGLATTCWSEAERLDPGWFYDPPKDQKSAFIALHQHEKLLTE